MTAAAPRYVDRILAALGTDPERPAVRWRDRWITAGEFEASIVGAARRMHAAGVSEGGIVALLTTPNSPVMLTARYAAHLLGAAVCHIRSTNPGRLDSILRPDEQAGILADTSAALLAADPESAALAERLGGAAGGIPTLVLDPCDTPDRAQPNPVAVVHAPDELAVLAHTSGSTGRPKGVRLSLRAWNTIVRNIAAPIPTDEPVRLLVVTPLSHTAGAMADAALAVSGSVVLHEVFDPDEALRVIGTERISRTFVSAPQLYRLLDSPLLDTADLSTLRQLLYSGCPAAPARLAHATRVFGPALVQGYGTTEGGRVTILTPDDHLDPKLLGTVGRPFPEVTIRVCDPETGDPVGTDGIGEVVMRSPHAMDGYWADPEATARALRDGWYHTGDLGSIDAAGYLRLVGRVADVVKTEGVKVHPVVVENVLMAHPDVAHAAVFGVSGPDLIEQVHAAIVPRPGATPDPGELRRHVAARLTPTHAPSVITLIDEIALTESGKPDKQRLRHFAGLSAGSERGEDG